MLIRATMLIPSQYAEKLPATRPERMLSEEPPSSDDVTTSFTCAECTDVKTFTSSGMTAPANVPQEMMLESFHQSVESPPNSGIINLYTTKVMPMATIEVSQTTEDRRVSKLMVSELPYLALAMASLTK